MTDNVQRGFRAPEDEPLFKQETEDPAIVPDKMTASVEGYFRIPAIWVGEKPDSNAQVSLNKAIRQPVVFTTTLSSGIEVRVLRNGTFLFDFSSWPYAPQIKIPGYRIPDPSAPYRQPEETSDAENRAEGYAVIRAGVMNIHQVCMLTAWWNAKRSSTQIGNPIAASAALKNIIFFHGSVPEKESEHIKKHRVVWEIEIIKSSLELLDQILSRKDSHLVDMVEAMYFATYRYSESRFGEALILAWEVCEQLVHLTWKQFLRARNIGEKRRKKWEGVDDSISIIIEILEINNEIAHELYLHLDTARKARNLWVHEMQMPEETDVRKAFQSAEKLLFQVKGISLSLQANGPGGGVPAWNFWFWESVQKKQEAK